ncbi:glycosyltransferase family 1 protein [Nesterenkonia salmonea]|uniref:Glycosyltransferase family 1 protein n=1 Tax=Nesterenkonia salmonea TaxID=1804987 RepID=A0A5R9BAS1_9MICC|nr:glycosyltransferase [Nesterenkonia salmonea]TLP97043.1 glycosyltransferase family 1 protein [Nesterenkonia salmonea]
MDLIVCSLEPWDDVWRRNQFLVDGLLRQQTVHRVLFVEPTRDPLHQIRTGQKAQLGQGLIPVPGYGGRLHRLELTKWLPRAVGPWAHSLLRRGVRGAVHRLGMKSPVLWINDPGWAHMVHATNWTSLYDITDDWAAAERPPREHQRIVTNDQKLVQRCDAVVVCSPHLAHSKGGVRPIELIRNAVDVARYREPLPRPTDMGDSRSAVYVGTLHEDRLDVDLCLRIGGQLAALNAALVLVGPNALSTENTTLLNHAPGVRLLGTRAHHTIPAYLQHADVLVVPHKVDEFTDSLDPIKLYEYQAAERPIAATPVSGFRELEDTPGVVIQPSDDLPHAVAQFIAEPPAQVGPFQLADWSDRVTAMAAVLNSAAESAEDSAARRRPDQ